jgi:histidinol phosphatase-like PHP family hydrolase
MKNVNERVDFMYLYETHMHTSPVSACASSSPEEMVRHYKSKGFTGVIVTDHFFNGNCGCPRGLPWAQKVKFYAQGYERAKKEGAKCDLDVFFGIEYGFHGTDFLVYGISVEYLYENPGFDKLSLEELSKAVRAEGGYIAQAHPFRTAFWIAEPSPADPSLIDGIEVNNASMNDKVNNQALKYAQEHGLAQQSGSDAHDTHMKKPNGIGLQKRAEDIFDIIGAIKAKEVQLVF